MKRHWSWMALQVRSFVRGLGWGGVTGLVGAAVVGAPIGSEAWEAHQALQAATQVAEQHPLQRGTATSPAPRSPWPSQAELEPWSWQLLRALQATGLRVESWHPDEVKADLKGGSSRRIQWRMRGHFADWHRFWQGLSQMGPHWSLERWRMQADPEAGELVLEGQWRQWVDGSTGTLVRDEAPWQDLAAWASRPLGPDPFVAQTARPEKRPPMSGPVQSKGPIHAAAPANATDPRHWSMDSLRLLAVTGPPWRAWLVPESPGQAPGDEVPGAWLSVGQVLAQGLWRIHRIGPDGVSVMSSPSGRIQTLNWKGSAHEVPTP